MAELFVAPYSRKLSWAELHLGKLENAMGEFKDSHPYETRKVLKGQNKGKWVLQFVRFPDPSWALILGDILYNLRASLDYLAAALNPSSERSHVMFPIVREPIWDIPFAEGENRDRTELRQKWLASTSKMDHRAVEIIKKLQPLPNKAFELYFHRLDLLNRLSNKDRHRTLHVHTTGLAGIVTAEFALINGETVTVAQEPNVPSGLVGTAALKDGAAITEPPGVDGKLIGSVQVSGTVTQAITIGADGRQAVVPDSIRLILDWIRNEAVIPLSPYLHGLKKN